MPLDVHQAKVEVAAWYLQVNVPTLLLIWNDVKCTAQALAAAQGKAAGSCQDITGFHRAPDAAERWC